MSARTADSRRRVKAAQRGAPRRVVIVHAITDSFEAVDLCRGVAGYRPRGGPWQLLTIPMQEPIAMLSRRMDELTCDGVVMMPGQRALLDRLQARGIPVVDVEGFTPLGRFPQVKLDDEWIGRLGGQHLVERGFQRLLYMGIDTLWSRARARGMAAVAAEQGVGRKQLFTGLWDEAQSTRWIERGLRQMEHPVGVMVCNDLIAARVVEVVCARGWEVATRVAILGVDDLFLQCTRLPVPLSSISTERYRAGMEAARLLDRQLSGELLGPEVTWIRPQEVTERQSTSAHVYGDPDVGSALAFIRARACDGVTTSDVVRHVGVSRSTLDRRFRELVGRLPGHELRRVRLAKAKQLLEQTHLPVVEIAEACGFSSISSLSHCFRAATGMSPLEHRNAARRR